MKIAQSSLNRSKTLWVKEKLLVTSNFSFSHSVFQRLVSQGRPKVLLCGNGLKDLSKMKLFVDDKMTVFQLMKFVLYRIENNGGKGENDR